METISPRPALTTILLVGGGVLVLGLCCLATVGGAIAYQLYMVAEPERDIIGSWKIDSAIPMMNRVDGYHFKQDGSYTRFMGITSRDGTWKIVRKHEDIIDVELTTYIAPKGAFPPHQEIVWFRFEGPNTLFQVGFLKTETRFRRN